MTQQLDEQTDRTADNFGKAVWLSHIWHICLCPQPHKPTARAKSKEPNLQPAITIFILVLFLLYLCFIILKKRNPISKLFLGAFFLAIYCNVLFTQFLCTYSHLSELTNIEQRHHDEAKPHSHEGSHEHNNSKDDDCCKDKTSAFFASQTNPDNSSFQFKNTFFTEFISFSNNTFVNTHSVNPNGYFSYESPPPKIPDIRIFIQSFQI